MRVLLKKFYARLDRKRLGHTWMSKPPSIRTDGVAFVEHKDSNIHAHCLVRIPLYELSKLKPFAETAWDRVIKGGTLQLDICCDRFDRAKYSTKEQLRNDYDWEEQIILLREFMRS